MAGGKQSHVWPIWNSRRVSLEANAKAGNSSRFGNEFATMAEHRIGIIGGSGLYHIEGFKKTKWVRLKTPFGSPSDQFLTGELQGRRVVFLPRHARGHRILPSEL